MQASDRHPAFVTRTNVLAREHCGLLIDCFERNRGAAAAHAGDAYWDGRYIWQGSLPPSELDAQRIMQQARMVAYTLLVQTWLPDKPVYPDTTQLVRWHEGLELTPHVDNLHPDGSANGTPHRSHSFIIYLNDDYDGGETFFPGYGVRLQPKAGALLLFGAGLDYVHGVTKITKGLRYTCAGWFTHDKSMAQAETLTVI
jgi:predicted 2-oxoglutarate/Fe(II)-dependent dioxygenase YbiX